MADSTTESEYFDEGHDDDDEERVGSIDPLGGVSTQSSALSWAPLAAATAASASRVKAEPRVAAMTHHDARRNAPMNAHIAAPSVHVAPLVVASSAGDNGGGGAAAAALSSAPRAEPAVVKNELPRVAIAHSEPPMSSATQRNSAPAAPTMAIKTQSPYAGGTSYTQPASAIWPPLPSTSPTPWPQPSRASSTTGDYKSPAAAAQPHNVSSSYAAQAAQPYKVSYSYGAPHGYRPPPPVDYAPPRLLSTQYQNLSASEAVTTTATTKSRAPVGTYTSAPPCYTATPLPTSSNQGLVATCRGCRASLNIPVANAGLDCQCCGSVYPAAQFPTQDNQDKSFSRRCEACYATYVTRSSILGPPPSPFATGPSPSSAATAATATAATAPRFTPIPPPPRIPSSPAVHQSAQAVQSSSLAASAPTAVGAAAATTAAASGTAQTPVASLEKCSTCRRVMFKVQPKPDASKNLECVCCHKALPISMCFSKTQRLEGKHRCMACLGHTKPGPSGEPVAPTIPSISLNTRSKQPTAAAKKKKKQVETFLLGAERQVAKYHLARRSLQRKREANDLRGATRVEYEKQLAKEEAELKVLEKQLRAKHPALFDKQSGIQVKAPSIPNDERDPCPTKKRKTPSKSELKDQKKKAQQASAALPAAANAVMRSATRRSSPDVINLTDEPSPRNNSTYELAVRPPKKSRVTMETLRAAANASEASLAFPVAAEASTKPKKRKAAIAASKSIAKEIAAKKPKVSKTSTTATVSTTATTPTAASASVNDDADPWLAAHDEIAQGLSQLLGGSLDDILSANVSVGSSTKKKSSTTTAKASAKAKAPTKAKRSQVKEERVMTESNVKAKKSVSDVKTEAAAVPVKKEKKARPDPSTYVPKTKLQAETPPQTTIVTRTRRRTLQPVEIIDITDSPPTSPRANRTRV